MIDRFTYVSISKVRSSSHRRDLQDGFRMRQGPLDKFGMAAEFDCATPSK